VADQCVGVEAGRVRRSLTRALLVLGGALIATALGWLLSAATASAAELPNVPVVPSDLVSSVVPAVTVPVILPATPALPATPPLPTPKLPATPPDLNQVAQQVHLAVAGDDRVVPSVLPVAVLVPSAPVSPVSTVVVAASNPVQQLAASQFVRPLSQHRHAAGGAEQSGNRAATSAPGTPAHPLPPVQPVGSSDTSAHGSGGPAGGAGGAQLPFVQLPCAAPNSVGTPTSPRLPVAPGHQPGTSPD
jgi:hypothetical protein